LSLQINSTTNSNFTNKVQILQKKSKFNAIIAVSEHIYTLSVLSLLGIFQVAIQTEKAKVKTSVLVHI